MNKTFALLTVKAVAETADEHIVTGIATTPSEDRVGDVVMPMGAMFARPMHLPFLLQHKSSQPIGYVVAATPTKTGIPFEARIPKVKEPGVVRDRIEEAVHSMKYRLMAAVSIGFNPIKDAVEIMKNGGMRFSKWEWLELSLVTIPANPDAVITGIKSIDDVLRAAPGRSAKPIERLPTSSPGASGHTSKGMTMPGINERIADLQEQIGQKAQRIEELKLQCDGDPDVLEDGEQKELDTLGAERSDLESKVKRLNTMNGSVATAKAVTQADGTDPERATRVRHGDAQMKSDLPPGTRFARAVIAKVRGRGSVADAVEYAKGRWKDTPEVVTYLKAAAGTTVSGNWADDLSQPTVIDSEFIELLRPATILGRLQGTRAATFNTQMISQTSGSTVAWVGEGAAKPVGQLAFSSVSIPIAKCAGIIVLSEEQIMVSHPNSENVVRQDLVAQVAQFLDQQFINPAITAVANTNPASITNGASNFAASGTTAAALRVDLYRLLGYFSNSNMGVGGLTLIMTSNLAMGLSLLLNPLGQREFPDLSVNGGNLLGMNVIVSDNVPGSSSSGMIVAIKPSEIYVADAGGVKVDVSREATLDMAGGNSPAYSLWQKNAVGLRAERWISWAKRRAQAVAYISAAAYVPS